MPTATISYFPRAQGKLALNVLSVTSTCLMIHVKTSTSGTTSIIFFSAYKPSPGFFYCQVGPVREQRSLLLSHTQMHVALQQCPFLITQWAKSGFAFPGFLQPKPSRHHPDGNLIPARQLVHNFSTDHRVLRFQNTKFVFTPEATALHA